MSVADPAAAPPQPARSVAPAPGPRRARSGVLAWTAPLATLGVLAALVGLVVLAIPVRTPLQDCGTSFTFLIDGRTDVFGDPADPPTGTTRVDVESNNAKACRARVADRAKPAAFLIPGGVVLGVVAFLTEAVVRLRRLPPRRPRQAAATNRDP